MCALCDSKVVFVGEVIDIIITVCCHCCVVYCW